MKYAIEYYLKIIEYWEELFRENNLEKNNLEDENIDIINDGKEIANQIRETLETINNVTLKLSNSEASNIVKDVENLENLKKSLIVLCYYEEKFHRLNRRMMRSTRVE